MHSVPCSVPQIGFSARPHVIHVVLGQLCSVNNNELGSYVNVKPVLTHLQSVARMVRRKQQNPKALLGPPESRQFTAYVPNALTAALPAQQSRSRPGGPGVAQKTLTVLTNVRSRDDNLLPLRHLQIDCENLKTSLTASAQPSLCLSITPESGHLGIAWNVSSPTSEDPRLLSVSQRRQRSELGPYCAAAISMHRYCNDPAGHHLCRYTLGC